MTKIKVCGLMTEMDAKFLNENQIEYAGFVLFFPKSRRNISIEQAKKIIKKLDEKIQKVAVVVSPTKEQISEIEETGFDVVQIHGEIENDLLDKISISVWRAFQAKDLELYDSYAKNKKINGFVFDAASPGSGKIFDWTSLKKLERNEKKWILAGGLNCNNVKEAIACINPDIVDVSSGVEAENKNGKDAKKIQLFACEVRR